MNSISNYNTNRLRLRDALKEFEQQIQSLTEDLERYRQKENASEKYIFYKQQQIGSLKNTIEIFIEFQENSTMQLIENSKEISKLNTRIFKLEGVCLYHGISNLNYYLRMRTNALIFKIKQAFNEGFRQIPFEIMEGAQLNKNATRVTSPTVPFNDLKNKALE